MGQKKNIESESMLKLEAQIYKVQANFDHLDKQLSTNLDKHETYCLQKNFEIDKCTTDAAKNINEINFWRNNTTAQKFKLMDNFLVQFGEKFNDMTKVVEN